MLSIKEIKKYREENFCNFPEETDYNLKVYGNCVNDTLVGINNIIKNHDHVMKAKDILEYKGYFADSDVSSCIVVAGGWSLNNPEIIETLQKLNGKMPIISCDTGAKQLAKIGVTPDFITILERLELTADKIRDVEFDSERQPIYVCSPIVDSSVVEIIKDKKHCFCSFKGNTVFQLTRKLGQLDWCCSSATMALSLANYIGLREVFLFGQDLCISDEGLSHGSNSAFGDKQENYYKNMVDVKCYDGKTRKSNSVLVSIGKEIERIVYENKMTVFNVNEKAQLLCCVGSYTDLFVFVCCSKISKNFIIKYDKPIDYKKVIENLNFWIFMFEKGDKDDETLQYLAKSFECYIQENEWLKNLVQGISMTTDLIYDNQNQRLIALFPAISDLLRVVLALFEESKVGVKNFDIGGNDE